jgi:hypothetical protein
VPERLTLALSLAGLAVTLAVAVARPPWLPEAVVAVVAAAGLVAAGAVSIDGARQAVATWHRRSGSWPRCCCWPTGAAATGCSGRWAT